MSSRHEFTACLKKGETVSALITAEEAKRITSNKNTSDGNIKLMNKKGNTFTVNSKDILYWYVF